MKRCTKNNYKKLRPVYEYAVFFYKSNDMIDFVCKTKFEKTINSKLYCKNRTYQLIITTFKKPDTNLKFITFFDKMHIGEIKLKNRLVCKNNAVFKIKNSFNLK